MFRRRRPRSWIRSFLEFFYPRGGWYRAVQYVAYRLRRLPDPADKIARGFAAGVFVSFTPFFGLHFFLSAGFAWLLRGNVFASLVGTFFGNPITFPIIAVTAVEIGARILGVPPTPLPQVRDIFGALPLELWANGLAPFTGEQVSWLYTGQFTGRVFWPYLVGGLGPGLIAALTAYWLVKPVIAAYQSARIQGLKRRYEARRDAQDAKRSEKRAPPPHRTDTPA